MTRLKEPEKKIYDEERLKPQSIQDNWVIPKINSSLGRTVIKHVQMCIYTCFIRGIYIQLRVFDSTCLIVKSTIKLASCCLM